MSVYMIPRLAVLLSGNGSNLQAMIEAIEAKKLLAKIVVVMSNKPDAYGLVRAQTAHIPTHILESKLYPTREQYDDALKELLLPYQPDLIIFSGFMRIVSKVFVDAFEGRILNLHPSLLPKYPGLNTYQRAIEAGDREHGSTVHIVTAELDAGPIILQRKVPIFSEDTSETLKQRTQKMEYELYPEAIKCFLSKR